MGLNFNFGDRQYDANQLLNRFKAIEIIKDKGWYDLKKFKTYDDYVTFYRLKQEIPVAWCNLYKEEEFKLMKEVFENESNDK